MNRSFVFAYFFVLLMFVSTSANVSLPDYSASLSERAKIISEISSENKSHGVSKELFLFIADKFKQIFKPIIDFELEVDWDNSGVNAFVASALVHEGEVVTMHDIPTIVMSGGMIRWKRSTPGTLVLTLCHELGHIATDSKFRSGSTDTSDLVSSHNRESDYSHQMEADYWTTAYCIKKVYENLSENDRERIILSGLSLPNGDEFSYVSDKCLTSYSDAEDVDMCVNLSAISIQFAQNIYHLLIHPNLSKFVSPIYIFKPEYLKSHLTNNIENGYRHTSDDCFEEGY